MSGSVSTAQQYLDKGIVFYNKGWLDEAINSYRLAIEMRTGNFPRAYYQLARALLDVGDDAAQVTALHVAGHDDAACDVLAMSIDEALAFFEREAA